MHFAEQLTGSKNAFIAKWLSTALSQPGAGVFDDTMKETLISVAKLLEANFEIFFRLPHHRLTDGFEPTKYPFYGGFLLLPPVVPSHDRQMIILHYATNT